jgi:hypothetical protein
VLDKLLEKSEILDANANVLTTADRTQQDVVFFFDAVILLE